MSASRFIRILTLSSILIGIAFVRANSQTPDATSMPIRKIQAPAELAEIRANHMPLPDALYWLVRGNARGTQMLTADLSQDDLVANLRGIETLRTLATDHPDVKVSRAIFDLVLPMLRLPDERGRLALDLIADADPAHATQRLIALAKSDSLALREKVSVMYLFGYTPPQVAAIDYLIAFLKQPIDLDDPSGIREAAFTSLAIFHETGDASLRDRIDAYLIPLFDADDFPEEEVYKAFDVISRNPRPLARPILERFVEQQDFIYPANLALLQLQGAAARPRIQALFDDGFRSFAPLNGLAFVRLAWSGDPDGQLQAMLKISAHTSEASDLATVLDSCWAIGGNALASRYLAALPQDLLWLPDLKEQYRLRYLPIDEQHPLLQMATALQKEGLLKQPLKKDDLEKLRRAFLQYGELDCAQMLMPYTLGFSDFKHTHFTGFFDRPNFFTLAAELMLTSGFPDLEMYVHNTSLDVEFTEPIFTVMHKGIGYQVGPYLHEERMPESEMIRVLHHLLAAEGRPERFVRFIQDGSLQYLFTTPEKAAKIIKIMGLGE
jgi:hypothetical protein